MKRIHKQPMSLSFEAVEILIHYSPNTRIAVTDTMLRHYTSGQIVTIRGYYWPVGTKADFCEVVAPPKRRKEIVYNAKRKAKRPPR